MQPPQVVEKMRNGHQYYMCSNCLFISLDRSFISAHVDDKYGLCKCKKHRLQITCFGCNNTFFSRHSLLSHIIYDHQMNEKDARILLEESTDNPDIIQTSNRRSGIKITSDIKIVPRNSLLKENSLDSSECEAHDTITNVHSADSEDEQSVTEPEKTILPSNTKTKSKKNVGIKFLGYKCSIDNCTVRLLASENVSYHQKCHNKEKQNEDENFKCPECSEFTSKYWRNLASHLWRSHIVDMELHACDLCNYKTPSLSKLINQHRGIHGNDRPFVCEFCGKGFKTAKQLRTHRTFHNANNKETFECEICQRIFKNCRLLKLHNNSVHKGNKPFSCNFCDYSASTSSVLKLHLRRHTGEKPFSCDQCSYSTGDHNSLRRHKLRHLGLKPYNCPYCTYACIQSSTYKVHLKNKHPGLDHGLMFSCEHCAYRSLNKGNFLTHMAKHGHTEKIQIPSATQTLPGDSKS